MTWEIYERALLEATRRLALTNGHAYVMLAKTRCKRCGRSPKQRGRCSGWFEEFCELLFTVMNEEQSEEIA